MFRDLLSSRALHVGFVLFVLIVGGTQLYSWHVRRGIKADEAARTQQFLQQIETAKRTRAQQQLAETDINAEVSSDALVATDDIPETVSDTTETLKAIDADSISLAAEPSLKDFFELTPEQQQEAIDEFYRSMGLEPPEPGYAYYWDENGTMHYHKAHEPIVEITTRIGFAPTRAQYEMYQRLQQSLSAARASGNLAKVRQLSAEIAQLKEKAQGEVPTGATIVTFGYPGESIESAKQRGVQRAQELLEKAREELGLEHLQTK